MTKKCHFFIVFLKIFRDIQFKPLNILHHNINIRSLKKVVNSDEIKIIKVKRLLHAKEGGKRAAKGFAGQFFSVLFGIQHECST